MLTLLATLGVLISVVCGAVIDSRQGSIKVMIVGDSISHGTEGDYTWRYRLWQWFQSNGIAVDFVGPYSGTNPPAEAHPPTPPALKGEVVVSAPYRTDGGYALDIDSGFDRDHFALWGRKGLSFLKEKQLTKL